MIKANNLYKKYRKKIAVNDISFEVNTGRVTGFLGPNGAGKSTTMRLMLGLDKGTGDTTFDGRHLYEYNQPSKAIGILLEAKAFHPTRTAREHLQVLAAAGNIPKERVDEVLDVVGLKDVAKRRPGKFSLGMSQRLGIAAAILGQPKYLMLDEPANGLDPEGIAWLRSFLKDYADQGNAVFVSSHLLSEMSLMADDLVVIGKGKLIANGSLQELISRNTSASVFVRATKLHELRSALVAESLAVEQEGDGLRVLNAKTDQVGKAAFKTGSMVLELANHEATLEEAFLQLTAGAEEYKTGDKKGEKS